MAKPIELLTSDSIIYRNLKEVAYKKIDHPLKERVVSMASVGNYVILGLAKRGCHVFSIHGDAITRVAVLGELIPRSSRSGARADRKPSSAQAGTTCHSICACTKRIIYIRESEGKSVICVHNFEEVVKGNTKPAKTLAISKRAPLTYESSLSLVAVGAGAWSSSSWTASGDGGNKKNDGVGSGGGGGGGGGHERNIRTLKLPDLAVDCEWEAADNAVHRLRRQVTEAQTMLGVADSRNGIRVFDLRTRDEDAYVCLFHVPVEEVRNFQLVGNYVGVFHKFEPNVSFWNMAEQKTILCINIQEQIRRLAEEYYEDELQDVGGGENASGGPGVGAGVAGDEDHDHVTCVSSVPFEEDHILIYGTRAGCVFGMGVDTRCKVFSVPLPHETPELNKKPRKDVLGVSLLPDGKMVACYEGYGLTMLDFSPEDPPDRPPTRGQPK